MPKDTDEYSNKLSRKNKQDLRDLAKITMVQSAILEDQPLKEIKNLIKKKKINLNVNTFMAWELYDFYPRSINSEIRGKLKGNESEAKKKKIIKSVKQKMWNDVPYGKDIETFKNKFEDKYGKDALKPSTVLEMVIQLDENNSHKEEYFNYVVKHSVDSKFVGESGQTILGYLLNHENSHPGSLSSMKSYLPCIQKLSKTKNMLNKVDMLVGSPLHYIVKTLSDDTVQGKARQKAGAVLKQFLEDGANPNITFGDKKITPLEAAITGRSPTAVRTLLNYGASIQPKKEKISMVSQAVKGLEKATKSNFNFLVNRFVHCYILPIKAFCKENQKQLKILWR